MQQTIQNILGILLFDIELNNPLLCTGALETQASAWLSYGMALQQAYGKSAHTAAQHAFNQGLKTDPPSHVGLRLPTLHHVSTAESDGMLPFPIGFIPHSLAIPVLRVGVASGRNFLPEADQAQRTAPVPGCSCMVMFCCR